MLAKRPSEQLCTVPWRLEGRWAFGPTEISAPCSAQLRPASPSTVHRVDPTRPDPPVACPGFGLDRWALVHWLAPRNEKRFSSRRSTGYQTLVNRGFFSSVGFRNKLDYLLFRTNVRENVYDFAGRQEGVLSLGQIDPKASRPTQPRPAPPPCCAPLRPDPPVVYLGLGFGRCMNSIFRHS